MKTALQVRGLSFAYPGGRHVLSAIDFDLEEKRTLGIIGPNGAGKTTLLLSLCGLMDFTGTVTLFGKPMTAKNARQIRARIGFVFQNPDDQLFMPTVREDIAFGLKGLGCTEAVIAERVREALAAVGLEGFEERSAHHCSFGEKRKITLATVMARRADLLIFDEPTRELDPGGRREFIEMMNRIQATKIIATHDLDLVLELCEDVLLINRKRVIARGTPRDLLSRKTLMESNRMEVPYRLRDATRQN